ncbi:hypothetical protein CPB84DRAFT_859701 [Gymnopilus junonius]|uniref:Uncharacterized protein n=1 Tax=Gymnopilus junonius TaxID=109634 RepID=A0A9P5TN82_GYMJU|nr:hypothetical protein CPB84DRAFT_859701 [Gymnopilus junonius]
MSLLFSSSSSSGDPGYTSGLHIGGGSFARGFASHSVSESAPFETLRDRRPPRYSAALSILFATLNFMAFPVCSVVLLMTGNVILRDSGNHHFSNHDMATAATIGGLLLFVISLIVLYIVDNSLLFLFPPQKYIIVVEAPPPGDFVLFLIALFGAPLCGVLGIAPQLAMKSKFQPRDLLYAAEAGFIGAAGLVGGWYTLLFCLMLLFYRDAAGRIVAQLLHLYRFRLRIKRRPGGRSSEPETTQPAATTNTEEAPPAYSQRPSPNSKPMDLENPNPN